MDLILNDTQFSTDLLEDGRLKDDKFRPELEEDIGLLNHMTNCRDAQGEKTEEHVDVVSGVRDKLRELEKHTRKLSDMTSDFTAMGSYLSTVPKKTSELERLIAQTDEYEEKLTRYTRWVDGFRRDVYILLAKLESSRDVVP